MIRCFLSLNIEHSLQNRLRLIQDDLKQELQGQKIKWENPDKFHLTLRFLGDTEPGMIKNINMELDAVHTGFEFIYMTVSGIGFFPNARYPNVVFAGLNDETNSSGKLVNELDKILGKYGFKPDNKFVPHITMGRFRREHRVKLNRPVNIKTEPLEFRLESFFMMKSTLKPGGSVYEVIKEFKFK